ncbi:toll-like receptor 2 [Nephila pilipes]|uniref:Toll-like receptor 2 n=1 Tax=Nephila pilipes TaxID=299642 RepID=A0A8X6PQG7_NEPPI|nr:toll-like receptor 2 [Nephila pilipes]
MILLRILLAIHVTCRKSLTESVINQISSSEPNVENELSPSSLGEEYRANSISTTSKYSSPDATKIQIDTNNNENSTTSYKTTRNYNEEKSNKLPDSENSFISPFSRYQFNQSGLLFFKRIPQHNSSLNEPNSTTNKFVDVRFFTFQVPKNNTSAKDSAVIPISTTFKEFINDFNFKKCNTTKNETLKNNYNLSALEHSNFTSNQMEKFNCQFSKNDKLLLVISCYNISVYDASTYIPNETVKLDISESPERRLLKPLFPHLTNLTSLRLHNNNHRYITRAFTGLQNLERLDLTNNYIMVLPNYVFKETPNLKILNLSSNFIIRINTIAIALSPLKHFTNLTLDHNLMIDSILESELRPLRSTQLKMFSLFNTSIQVIQKGAFQHLPFLDLLDLSLNYMNEEALTNVTSSIQSSSMKAILATALNGLTSFPYSSVAFLKNISIYRLDFRNNFLLRIDKLPYIPFLKSLWLSHCYINYIEEGAFDELPNLEELVLDNNELLKPPLISPLINLKTLVLSDQSTQRSLSFLLSDFQFENSPNLEILILSNVFLRSWLFRNTLHGLNSLNTLDLTLSRLVGIKDYAFETLSSLKFLSFRGNFITYLTNYTFYGLRNLTNLYLTSNFLHFSETVYPFQYTPLLKVITLENNEISTFPENFFDGAYNLKILLISNNKLLPWTSKILRGNISLTTLDLSQNQINYVSSAMISDFKQVRKNLRLSQNPFNCSACGMWEFQKFLNSSNLTLHFSDIETDFKIVCAEPKIMKSKSILDVEMPIVQCAMDDIGVLSLVTVVSVIIVLLLVSILFYLCYFFRWYVRYWVFHVKAKIKEKTNQDINNEQPYMYDAFVSYNSRDNHWVVKHLIPALENEDPRYKLCVHLRNFQIGRLITENILEAIENSRNVILILTEDFVTSEWCMFELHMAQHRLFDDTRDCLILIKFKDLDKRIYTKNLKYLEKTRTCLTWTEDKTGQKLFWEKMKKVLGPPINSGSPKEINI